MKNTKRTISFIFVAVLVMLFALGASISADDGSAASVIADLPSEGAANGEVDEYAVDPVYPVIIDMSSMESVNQFAELPENALLGNGSASFNAEEGALSLGYAAGTSGDAAYDATYVKCGIRMKSADILAGGQKYMVVTYKTNIDEAVSLKLNNIQAMTAAQNLTLAADVSVSNGKWVHSEPINIDNGVANGRNHFYRFNTGNVNIIFLDGIGSTTDFTDKYFYIKDIAFFATEEEANEYAVDPLYPVIIDYSSKESAERYVQFTSFPLDTVQDEGYYTFDESEQALSLIKTENVIIENKDHGNMRYTLKPKEANLFEGRPYMVITYKTNIENKLALRMWNFWGHFCEPAADVSVSNGRYVRSAPFNIDLQPVSSVNSNYFTRFNNGMHHNMLSVTEWYNQKDAYFYIKEIAFFATEEEANEYSAVDPVYPVIIDMSSMETVNRFAELPENALLGNGSASFNAEEGAFALGYAAGTSGDAEYDAAYVKCGIKIRSASVLASGQKYMVVTYKTNIDESVSLKLNNIMGMAARNNLTLDADVSVSNGNWVHSKPINIDNGSANNANHFHRFATANTNVIFLDGIGSTTDFTDKYFYIKEIAFFATEEEANKYAVDPVYPVIIDMSSREAIEKIAELPENALLGNGSASFNAEEGAFALGYAAGTSGDAAYDAVYVKCGIKTKNAGILADGQKYMVVTYKTNIDEAVSLKLNNIQAMTAAQNLTLAADVSVSNGNWVHSKPINIDNGVANGRNHFYRFNTGNVNIIFLDGIGSATDFTDKYFYIKEIAFFATEEEANKYAVDPVYPVIINMSSKASAEKYLQFESFPTDTKGNAGYYTFDANEQALSLMYTDQYVIDGFEQGTMRYTLKPKALGLFSGRSYMVVTYKTNITDELPLYIGNYWKHLKMLAPDVSISNGEYVRTAPVDINKYGVGTSAGANYFIRINELGSHVHIGVNNKTDENAYFYIKEIAFFENPSQAYEYYGETAPCFYFDGKLGDFSVLTVLEGDGMGEWSYSDEDMFTLSYTDKDKYSGNYRMMYKFVDFAMIGENRYMRVEYKADNGSSDSVSLVTESPATNERIVIESAVENTNGEWVLSAPAELTGDLYDRLGGTGVYAGNATYEKMHHEHNALVFTSSAEDASYSVKNIYFFETLEDANSFVVPEDVEPEAPAPDSVFEGTAPDVTPSGEVNLKYDDQYTFDKEVAHIENISITSNDTVTGEPDSSVLKRVSGETFAASAIGTANVYFTDGTAVSVNVTAAPLNVLLLIGQSNAEGFDGSSEQSIRNIPGQVYSTYACAGYRYIVPVLGPTYNKGIDVLSIYNSNVFVPAALAGDRNRIGTKLNYNLDELCTGGFGKGGMDSAIAYEWNKQTGEKVWVINAAHSGSGIESWIPGSGVTNNNFWQAVGVMKSAEQTLQEEIAAGHYTLSHMGYYWLQGCTDTAMDPDNYTEFYMQMRDGFMEELTFDHDGDSETPERGFEFGAIMLVRTSDANNAAEDFFMKGPRLSQYYMGNETDGAYADIFVASNITDIFRNDSAVAQYFVNKYGTNDNFKKDNGGVNYDMPTTVNEVHPAIHYSQIGYTEIGRDAAYNTLCRLGEIEPAESEPVQIKFIGADGFELDCRNGISLEKGESITIVPVVSPRYVNDVTYKINGSLSVDNHYTFKSTDGGAASIIFTSGDTAVVVRINHEQSGSFTAEDLIYLGRALAKWNGYALPEDTSVFDLNSDGRVNPLDLVYLARHLAGWDGYKVLPIA